MFSGRMSFVLFRGDVFGGFFFCFVLFLSGGGGGGGGGEAHK